ncbi:MAG: sulfurtransferase [Thermovirga sp.]|nr:sulfurtransferase [Thermovirga sp.]
MVELRKIVISVMLACIVLTAVAAAAFAAEGGKQSLYVSPEWLKAHRNSVVIVDARPKSLYANGHIPGAVNAEWTYFANMKGRPGSPGWGDLYPKHILAKKIGALGIDGKKPVVVYADPGGWGQDGWVVWILRLSGIENAKMLEGGFLAWKAAGGKVSTKRVVAKAKPFKIESFRGGYNVTTPWLKVKLGEVRIIDARTPFEYQGARIFQERRGGHIPGAINIPYDSVFNEDQTVKDVGELKALFQSYGLSPDDEIVVYDTAGVRSAYLVLVLRMAGFENARNYDSSFHEWAGTPELEVVQGSEPGAPSPLAAAGNNEKNSTQAVSN